MSADTLIQVDLSTFLTFLYVALSVLILGPVAWIVKGLLDSQREMKEAHGKLKDELHLNFVRKEDLNSRLVEIKELILRLFDKLEGKADK